MVDWRLSTLLQSFLFFSVITACEGAYAKYAQKLLTDLMTNYTSALRPVEDTNTILNVTLQVTLSQIIDMDERNQILTAYLWIRQVWFDAHLKWNKDEYDGLDTIRIPGSYVWRPDIVLYNSADNHFTGPMDTNVVIRHDGQMMWDSPAITKSSCKVDVSFFPFDGQQCRFTYGSWTYNGNQLDILNAMENADLADLVENVEWEVLGMPAKRNIVLYGCCADPYPDVTYTLMLQRRASFYVFNLLIPCVMISFLAPLGFYLPADSGEKVSLGVTVMLALTVFQLLVAEIMPPSENVPLIGKYYIATMTMITASTALTIFIMNIHHCGPDAKPVPKWAKKVILQYMARMCFVYEVGENCMSAETEKHDPPFGGNTNCTMNGQVGLGREDCIINSGQETVRSVITEEKEENDQILSPLGSVGKNPTNQYSTWKKDILLDYGEPGGPRRCRKGGVSGGERKGQEISCNTHANDELLLHNIEYIASCYRDQRAMQRRTGEWKKVAKVLDRFFMWMFFIMVFFMSLLIMGKAI
ncbi:neuronal acetylcholine receptor subunit alpha-10a [Cyprinodon tularosa]|uniref:Cholinergic receptor, nicotinic, alpha 10a n=1 Tax=Cyprinodon variegatus TaxID=28743 RepID=A0A3Q2DQE6_CYPVA|nr:PREDICTED: neuronal acetylcholine receptor subunit alpha-9-like [Cyprinodon variegatus]XP_038147904.1 neuronal acetylcholine receptor subunit alpha-10a [Cyprinodon tularosa]